MRLLHPRLSKSFHYRSGNLPCAPGGGIEPPIYSLTESRFTTQLPRISGQTGNRTLASSLQARCAAIITIRPYMC